MLFKNIKKGFSLLELILVLGVGTMVAFMKFQDMRNEQENILASAVGQQMKQIGEAVNGYINIRYDKLALLSNATGTGTDPGPRACNGSVCEISYQTLVNEGLLPSSYTGINAQKSPYKILLKRDGTSPNYVINGVITTAASWTENDNIRYDLLGKAMFSAGIDSGVTKTSTAVSGYNEQWTETSTNFNNITTPGQLAFRVGYNSALYSVYLRRDGTLPMTGDLNMGGNNISNVKNITASGKITTTDDISGNNISANGQIRSIGNIISGANLISHNGYGNPLTIGGDNAGDDFEIKLSGQKQLDILSDNSAPITLAANGNIEVRNPQNGVVGVNLNHDGSINTIGKITASGNITSSQIISAQYLKTNQIIVAGATCSDNGLIAKDSEGSSLNCVNGKWTKLLLKPTMYHLEFEPMATTGGGNIYKLLNLGSHLFCVFSGEQANATGGLTKHAFVYQNNDYTWTLEMRIVYFTAGVGTWAKATCFD